MYLSTGTDASVLRAPRIYVVASVPRSGSTLLVTALRDSGIAGQPREYFNQRESMPRFRDWDLTDDQQYWRELLARTTTPNGVFGTKAHIDQYCRFHRFLSPSELDSRNFVFIRRQDHLRQAVSLTRLMQPVRINLATGQTGPAGYDRTMISNNLFLVQHQEQAWRQFFRRFGLQPMEIVYEDFIPRYESVIEQLLDHLAIQRPAGFCVPPPGQKKVADDVNEQWFNRFEQEAGQLRWSHLKTYAPGDAALASNTGLVGEGSVTCLTDRDKPGHCLFGPGYRPGHAGSYRVSFTVSGRHCPAQPAELFTFDIYDRSTGQVPAVLSLFCLACDGTPRDFHLEFNGAPAQELEFRVYWHGGFDAAVFNVSLSRIE